VEPDIQAEGKMQAELEAIGRPNSPTLTEQLGERAKDGDKDAFRRLVELYSKAASAVAFTIVRDWSTAQDIAQDAFLAAYRSLHKLDRPVGFGPWLLRIVRNIALTKLRELERESRLWAELANRNNREDYIQENAERREEFEELDSALSLLPQGYREILLLRYMGNRSLSEIGEQLGLTVNGAETRLKRARGLLLKAYRKQ